MIRGIVPLLVLVSLTSCSHSDRPALLTLDDTSLSCAEPAPVFGEPEPGYEDDYFVCFKDGVDVSEEAARLAATHGFTPRYVYTVIPCLAARDLSQGIVDALRCESTVDHLSYDGPVVAL